MSESSQIAVEDQAPKKSSGQIFEQEVEEGVSALDMPAHRLFISALAAGLEVALTLLVLAILRSNAPPDMNHLALELLAAAGYSFGFIAVVLGRSELFTEQTTLAILPLLAGQSSIGQVARLWAIVYIGNLIGAAICAYLITIIGPALHQVDLTSFHEIASSLTDHPSWVILLSGLFAGWLMGLVSWIVAASRDTISQITIILVFTGVIGLGHLHHSILGTAEVLGGLFSNTGTSLDDFGHFLLWSTLGNAIGGAGFVALLKFGHARTGESA
jgi:formate/nitrite transporter FocA (FNT family)